MLFFYFISLLLAYWIGFNISWWMITGLILLHILFLNWNRWRRVNAINPNQTIEGLIALLRIRSAEIGAMYHSIREYQKDTSSESWIPRFMAEYRSESSSNVYEPACEKKEKKHLQWAHAIYNKRFSYDHYYGRLNEQPLTDISIGVLYWATSPHQTIQLLKSISCDANLSKHVCALIKQYQLLRFFSFGGSYNIIFRNRHPFSSLTRRNYQLLCSHWKEALHALQSSILTAQAGAYLKPLDALDVFWTESQILATQEWNLARALSQKSGASNSDRKNEALFFESLDSNPIWKKIYGHARHSIANIDETNMDSDTQEIDS